MGSVANGGQELLQILEGTQETGRRSATCRHNSSECIAIWVTVILPQADTAAMREHLKVITDAVAPARESGHGGKSDSNRCQPSE